MLARKVILPRTLRTLLPPNYDYAYFAGAGTWRFRGAADGFDPVNATWLADAALLAYADDRFVQMQWQRAGATSVRVFRGPSTVAHVAECDEAIIVAFRGTQVRKPGPSVEGDNSWRDVWLDIVTDLDIRRVPWLYGESVHQGFRDALAQVWPLSQRAPSAGEAQLSDMGAYLQTLVRPGADARRIWLTGHSLGGALATLAAQACRALALPAVAYTFGSPRVGTRVFAASYDVPHYRIVHGRDGVARVPPWGYCHIGELHRLSSDPASAPLSTSASVKDWLWRRFPGAASFADHSPLYYATHLWNRCVDAHDSERHRSGAERTD